MNILIIKRTLPIWACFLGIPCLSAWASGGGDGLTPSAGTGTGTVQLSWSAGCNYKKVNVTVDHVKISRDGTGWTTIPLDSSVGRIDLLSLTNGILVTLGQVPLPVGTYQQVRLVLKENGSAEPWANSVVLTGATGEMPLQTLNVQQSGYKIIGPLAVQNGKLTDLVLD